MKKQTVPFPRSYWVVPGKFLAGYYPGSRDSSTAQRKLEGLLEHGIRHLINLMEEHELNFSGETFVPYEQQLENIAAKGDIPIKLVHMPIRDTDVPTVEGMVAILDEIDRGIKQNPRVYLHCWGGRGRTGTVVGCYLARHGMPWTCSAHFVRMIPSHIFLRRRRRYRRNLSARGSKAHRTG
jgi:protein tyrosine/serine phosphatase